jgi:hypothetical protein
MENAAHPIFKPDEQPWFSHQPLTGKRCIRLLDIHPGLPGDALKASLRMVDLDGFPEYEALSYLWGDVEPKREVSVDERPYIIRPNIYSFLLRLRLHDIKRTVWNDAICINQNDLSERGQQVALMGEVYARCRRCLVWLGEPRNRGDEVLQVFRENPVDERGMTDLNNLVRLLYTNRLSAAAKELLTNVYWSRVWMIQETTLPKEVVVLCGDASCLLDNIPTQVRANVFELFQQNRKDYSIWLSIFSRVRSDTEPRISSASIQQSTDTDPCILSRIDRNELQIGFRKAHEKPRCIPVVMQMAGDNDNAGIVTSTISLSTASGLSFSQDEFDASEAFFAIEFVFWCIGNTKSEQLLSERRRYSAGSNISFASTDFRNFLGRADRWHCTDIRDRVFGALGVFRVWPRSFPFAADYHLNHRGLLVSVVDYCRATDPFKLAISLSSALSLPPQGAALEKSTDLVTVMSRISWAVEDFSHEPFDVESDDGPSTQFVRLERRSTPGSAQAITYRSLSTFQLQDGDILISIGDAAMVLGIRRLAMENKYSCVGIGFDSGKDDDVLLWLTQSDHRRLMRALPGVSIKPADETDKGEDGTPVLWWIELPDSLFWLVCTYEALRRALYDEEQYMPPEVEASDGTGEAIADTSSGGIPSSRADSF